MALLNLSQINKEKNFIENNYLLQWKKQTVFGMDRMYASDLYHCADREKFRPFGPTKIPREIDTTHAIAQVPRRDGRGRERGQRTEEERCLCPSQSQGKFSGCVAQIQAAMPTACGRREGRLRRRRTLATDPGQTLDR